MKRPLLIALTILLSTIGLSAQSLKKGDRTLAASSTGISYSKTKNTWNLSIGINGTKIIEDYLAVEYGVNYTNSKFSTDMIKVGAGLRLYLESDFYLGLAPQIAYLNHYNVDLFLLAQLSAGYDIFITKNIFIAPSVRYNVQIVSNKNNKKSPDIFEGRFPEEPNLSGFAFALSIGIKF